ncbi:aminotransferase class III-fold pyridoxal phosphate-dependent enzyme [Protofrankia symbiont of Coriaria ruscifolia]|uniref:Uncharacterized protein n=1 Tax=Candidatus Protofrankia californiensis TaxID=1839754 RepID=A0A1C3P114_9ACTN|nr:hypothetical protein FDG2_3785 [Candidatus Protofrankia californiensis]
MSTSVVGAPVLARGDCKPHLPASRAAEGIPDSRVIVYEAEGCYLDTDRGELLDACSGAVNVNVGHRHPQVLRALHEQYSQAHFTSRGRFTSGAARETGKNRGRLRSAHDRIGLVGGAGGVSAGEVRGEVAVEDAGADLEEEVRAAG